MYQQVKYKHKGTSSKALIVNLLRGSSMPLSTCEISILTGLGKNLIRAHLSMLISTGIVLYAGLNECSISEKAQKSYQFMKGGEDGR